MKCGNVIKVEEFEFLDGNLDVEGYERRCIVLFETEYQVCVCPIVSQVDSFNNNPEKYYLLPISNRNGKKLTFAKLNSVVYINKCDVLEIEDHLEGFYMSRIIDKLRNNYLNYGNVEYYEETLNKIEENILVK